VRRAPKRPVAAKKTPAGWDPESILPP
jgi:hypothetical protein